MADRLSIMYLENLVRDSFLLILMIVFDRKKVNEVFAKETQTIAWKMADHCDKRVVIVIVHKMNLFILLKK